MPLPSSLEKIIEDALIAIQHQPAHDLNLGYRQAIWAALGPGEKRADVKDTTGHNRRTTLAVHTARHVLSVWERVWPQDDTPRRLLYEAEQVRDGVLEPARAREHATAFWTWLDDALAEYEDHLPAIYAGSSAVLALRVAIRDEHFDPDDIDYARTDADLEPYDSDPAFFAAAAYANGSIWDSESNAGKRYDFWKWWLTEAVPVACQISF